MFIYAWQRFVREELEKKLEAQRKGYETEIKRVNQEKDKVSNENHYLRAELEHYKNRQQHMDSDDRVQEKLISFDSRLSQSNFSGKPTPGPSWKLLQLEALNDLLPQNWLG